MHDLVQVARQQLGKPYQHMQHGPDAFDCLGLLKHCADQLGVHVEYDEEYSRCPSGARMKRELLQYCDRVRLSDAKPGDIFHVAFNDQPQHLMLLTYAGHVIHADADVGRVVEHHFYPDQYRIRGVYRLKESLWRS